MWKRYVDVTICFAKMDTTNLILTTLNSFHNNIKFTIEIKKRPSDAILGRLSYQNTKKAHTTVYCKKQILSYIFIGILLHQTNESWKQ